MPARLLPALAAGTLTLALLGPVAAVAVDRGATGPSLPSPGSETASEQATEALEQAQRIFGERSPAAARRLLADGGADATMALNQLLRVRDDLTGSEREQADTLLVRPTSAGGDGIVDYTVREATPHCGGVICVHYVRRTADAPSRADADGDRVPNAVEQTLSLARQVHTTYTGSGYRRPDSDGTRGGRRDKVDIYLADLGDRGIYGYCTSDQRRAPSGTSNRWAYCAVDDDFARDQFPSKTPTMNRKVTLAHEYYHAVQFAYDTFEDPWFLEATATWAEDEVFDEIDDNRQFLADGQLGRPDVPLDLFGSGGNHYGNWLFFRYLTESWTEEVGSLPSLVLEAWRNASGRAGAADMYSTRAVEEAVADRGTSFATSYSGFAVANRDPQTYEEGAAYQDDVADPAEQHTLSTTASSVERSIRLDHLSSVPLRFVPDSDLEAADRWVDIAVDMPGTRTAPFADVVVHRADGTTTSSTISLADDGSGSTTVPFSPDQISDVELVLGNASLRTDCRSGTNFACRGNPRDDDLLTTYRATVVRR